MNRSLGPEPSCGGLLVSPPSHPPHNPASPTKTSRERGTHQESGPNHSDGSTNAPRRACRPATGNADNKRSRSESASARDSMGVGWPEPIDLIALAGKEPSPPIFIVDDWLPCGYATLFAGHGGVGKSGIALHLAGCIAMGLPFFGMPVQQRSVLYLSCEDREEVLHWRLAHICGYLGVTMSDLPPALDVLDLVGHESIVWARDPRTGASRTPAFGALAACIRKTKPQVLIVDGITDTFGGNENEKSEVKQFVNALVGLIPAEDGAVLLVGHVAKLTARAGGDSEGYSGTTGWHNAVRARWYLYPEKSCDDDECTSSLLLELQKSNLGRADQSMRFTWNDDAKIFVGETISAASKIDKGHRDKIERDGILAALRASIAAGVPVPTASTGRRTTYHVLSARAEFPETLKKGKAATRRFWEHMEFLQQSRAIKRDTHRKASRHKVEIFTCVGCAND